MNDQGMPARIWADKLLCCGTRSYPEDTLYIRSDVPWLLAEALEIVRGIISEAAATGFNCHDGDWAERLFASQSMTHAALSAWHAATYSK